MSRFVIRASLVLILLCSVSISLVMWHGKSLPSWTVMYRNNRVTSGRTQEWNIYEIDVDRNLRSLFGTISRPLNTTTVSYVTLSPNRRYFVCLLDDLNSSQGRWELYDVIENQPISIGAYEFDGVPLVADWLPDEQFIAYSVGAKGVIVRSADHNWADDYISLILDDDVESILDFFWIPETYLLRFVVSHPQPRIIDMNTEGDIVNSIPIDRTRISGATFSPNGQLLAFQDNPQALNVVEVDTGVLRILDSLPLSQLFYELYWSPDSQGVLLYTHEDQELYLLDVETGNYEHIRQVINPLDTIYWSPDGSYVALAFNAGMSSRGYELVNVSVINLDDNDDVISFSAIASQIPWSLDNTQIAYLDAQTGQLMILNVESSSARQLTDSPFAVELVQ